MSLGQIEFIKSVIISVLNASLKIAMILNIPIRQLPGFSWITQAKKALKHF